jgi:FKBP-type peptidyl-prolyl cis-trans isomerase
VRSKDFSNNILCTSQVGDGAVPIPGDTVRVHYTGWLEDFESEKKFDSSYDRRKPLVFKV